MKLLPMVDVAGMAREEEEELVAAFREVLRRGDFILGSKVAEFEEAFAADLGASACVGVNSGTDALVIALAALGIGEGDEVITTPFTFAATAEAIVRVGAIPVFADIDAEDFNLAPEQVEACITPRTKAILPVHLFGQMADMPRLMALAEAHGLFVIEDCAQATGAELAGRKAGAWGDCGCFSFFPSKNLSGFGDGGMIAFRDPELAARARALRNHGQFRRYEYAEIGWNSRLDTVQAALLLARLPRLAARNAAREKAAAWYDELLADLPVVRPRAVRGRHVWHQYTILLPEGADRAQVQARLREQGIASAVYYPQPLTEQPAYRRWARPCPVAEEVSRRCLSLPMHPLLTREDCARVAEALARALGA